MSENHGVLYLIAYSTLLFKKKINYIVQTIVSYQKKLYRMKQIYFKSQP